MKNDCEENQNGTRICADPVVRVPIKSVTVHPKFSTNDKNRRHDIAIIELRRSIEYTSKI